MNKHSVLIAQRIEREEIVMIDEKTISIALSSKSLISDNLTIIINHSGSSHNHFNMMPVEFHPHNIAVVLPGHIINVGEYSEDYRVTLIIISRNFYEEMVNRESFMNYVKYQDNPNFALSEEQYSKMMTVMSTLRIIVESDHPKRHEILANILDIIFYALTRYRGEEEQEKTCYTRLFNNFYKLLINNYHQHHDVIWYAEQLCLTPKYFSSVIRESTGKSAAQWIDEVLVVHSKRLLHTRRDMTVQQIAYELGFNGSATFCRFFKDQTGLRPSEYRKGH
jgi:AraC-like DNA-binding protein